MSASIAEQRQAAIAEAKSWLRTPFHDNAMVKNAGVACGPLLIAVYGAIGIPVPTDIDWSKFPRDWHLHTTEERYWNVVSQYSRPVETPEPGDMVLARFSRQQPVKPFCHGGVVVEWPLVIHAYWGKGVEYADVSKGPLAAREKCFLSPWA